ncbi:uncharacterized protein [Spinacia oleracea]|uniref:Uncharacterized protein isoform X2 n=1 Tax=Spinacia oleracea TaxID=3562 RepID=A0ABM3RUB8_SPIOL|nr:uncharacterized protein LOC110805099 isoform X2 [Spinacia oleracea]
MRWIGARIHLTWTAFRKGLSIRASMAPTAKATLCSRRIHLLKEREGGRALEARKGYPHDPCRSSTSSKLVEQSGLLEVPGFFCRYKLLNFPNTLLPQVVKPSPSAHVATSKASILVLHLQTLPALSELVLFVFPGQFHLLDLMVISCIASE